MNFPFYFYGKYPRSCAVLSLGAHQGSRHQGNLVALATHRANQRSCIHKTHCQLHKRTYHYFPVSHRARRGETALVGCDGGVEVGSDEKRAQAVLGVGGRAWDAISTSPSSLTGSAAIKGLFSSDSQQAPDG